MQATPEDILAIARLVQDLCGLVLDASKGYLVESRLGEVAEALGCGTFSELAYKARTSSDRALHNKIIDAITTQETLFFRDGAPFEAMQYKIIPDLIDRKAGAAYPNRLRIWSAACSTGQEPYSIAITLCDAIPNISMWDVSILGTDISNAAIRQASMGRYAKHEIQRGMRPDMLARYFREDGGAWKVKDELRAMVTFSHRNLLQPFADLGPFDVIFCRNVAIYFDAQTRRDLFLRLADRLTQEGCLFVGSSECLVDLGSQFLPKNYCRTTYYMPRMSVPQTPAAAARPIFSPLILPQTARV